MHLANDKARAHELTFRAMDTTAADTLSWYKCQPEQRQPQLLLGFNGINSVEDSMAREREILDAWHARSKGEPINTRCGEPCGPLFWECKGNQCRAAHGFRGPASTCCNHDKLPPVDPVGRRRGGASRRQNRLPQ